MSRQEDDISGNATLQSIMTALEASYGNLAQPDLQKVYVVMKAQPTGEWWRSCEPKAST